MFWTKPAPPVKAETSGIFSEKSDAFYLSEYACLRKEIELLLEDYRTLERNVVFAVGISWAWLIGKNAPVFWIFIIPFVFAVLGTVRATGIHTSFRKLRNYIQTLESAFIKSGGPTGWEHYPDRARSMMGAATFWGILIG